MKGWKSQVKRETYYSVPVQLYPKQPHHQKMQNICVAVACKITATLCTPLVIMNWNFDTITL